MQSAAAARILVRASAAACSRWVGRLAARAALPAIRPPRCLTVQSVSDARVARVRRQGPSAASSARVDPLDALFAPRTVAIVGASADSAKWGHILAQRALASPGDRTVLLVNRHGGEVLGRPTYPSARAAAAAHERTVDLAVLCVPASGFVASVTDAVAAGARAIVAITAGLSEAGPEGARLEAEALAIARDAGAVLVGPNCLGIVDTTTGLQLAHAVLPAGDVAVLSQSGNLVLDLAGLLADRGLGVSRFVSLGNQADLGVVDFLHACVGHDGTRAVAVYTEDVVDGRAFLDAARALRDAGKPLVLLAPGRTEAAVRSAASHTGSLTSSSMVIDAACAAVGAHRVRPPDPAGRPAGRPARAAADARPPGRDPHRRGRARSGGRRRARRGRAADPGADRRGHRPSSRRRCGRRRRSPTRSTSPAPVSRTSRAMPGESRPCSRPTRSTACC